MFYCFFSTLVSGITILGENSHGKHCSIFRCPARFGLLDTTSLLSIVCSCHCVDLNRAELQYRTQPMGTKWHLRATQLEYLMKYSVHDPAPQIGSSPGWILVVYSSFRTCIPNTSGRITFITIHIFLVDLRSSLPSRSSTCIPILSSIEVSARP